MTAYAANPISDRQPLVNPAAFLLILLIATAILPVVPFTALIAALALLYVPFTRGAYNLAALKLALPFLFMPAYGLLLSGGNDPYEVGKDLSYAIKLALCLALGLLIGVRTTRLQPLFDVLIWFSVAAAAGAGALFILDAWFDIVLFESEAELRIPLVCVGAIPLLLERLRPSVGRFSIFPAIGLATLLFAVATSNSRITIIAAIAFVAAWAGVFSSRGRALKAGLPILAVLVIAWQLIPDYGPGDFSLLAKFRRSLDEIAFTDAYDPTAMIWNWRGFEAYNAQLMFDQASTVRKLLGQGLGSTVNLGVNVQMSEDMSYQYLPILHNGFYYVLIKYGLVGVLVYVLAVLSWVRAGAAKGTLNAMAIEERIMRGAILTVLLTTTVITGLFNRDGLHAMTLLIAVLIGRRLRRRPVRRIESRVAPVRRPATGFA